MLSKKVRLEVNVEMKVVLRRVNNNRWKASLSLHHGKRLSPSRYLSWKMLDPGCCGCSRGIKDRRSGDVLRCDCGDSAAPADLAVQVNWVSAVPRMNGGYLGDQIDWKGCFGECRGDLNNPREQKEV